MLRYTLVLGFIVYSVVVDIFIHHTWSWIEIGDWLKFFFCILRLAGRWHPKKPLCMRCFFSPACTDIEKVWAAERQRGPLSLRRGLPRTLVILHMHSAVLLKVVGSRQQWYICTSYVHANDAMRPTRKGHVLTIWPANSEARPNQAQDRVGEMIESCESDWAISNSLLSGHKGVGDGDADRACSVLQSLSLNVCLLTRGLQTRPWLAHHQNLSWKKMGRVSGQGSAQLQ